VYWTCGCDELELLELLLEVVEFEALLEDKEGLGPTSPQAARTSNVSEIKDSLLVLLISIKFPPLC
jgi:hypothetical protein